MHKFESRLIFEINNLETEVKYSSEQELSNIAESQDRQLLIKQMINFLQELAARDNTQSVTRKI